MHIHKLSIDVTASKTERESLHDQAISMYSALYQNGQAQEHDNVIYFDDRQLVLILTTMEKNSLSKKYENCYVKKFRSTIERMCRSRFKVERLGQEPPYDEEHLCRCIQPKSLYIRCSELNYGCPLSCGDCGKNVPLYRISRSPERVAEKEYHSLCCWDRSYRACYRLEALCGFAERWATRQMQEYDSGLFREGREVCEDISKHAGVPVYYYLFNYRGLTVKQDQSRKCPGCGDDWFLKEPWHTFDFKCDDCLLISELTTNSRK